MTGRASVSKVRKVTESEGNERFVKAFEMSLS